MSTPGDGWQQPDQPRQPGPGQPPQPGWQQPPPGWQPPPDQQQWGQQPNQPQWGQPTNPPPNQPPNQQQWGQPGQQQPWGAPAPYGQPPAKSGSGRLIGITAGVVALVAVVVLAFTFIGGGPEAGDCVSLGADNEVQSVDCGSGEAQYRLAGIDTEHADLTYPEFLVDDSTCSQFGDVRQQIWEGDTSSSSGGTIYCLSGL